MLSAFACFELWYDEPGSLRQCWINWLGQFGARQLAWIERSEGEPPLICFGYELQGRKFKYESVPANRVRSVEWSLGHASSITGTDMNDWHVCLWFQVDQRTRRAHGIERNGERQSLHLIGQQGPKQTIADIGLAVVKFLEMTGIVMIPSDDGCRYSVDGDNNDGRPEFWKVIALGSDRLEAQP